VTTELPASTDMKVTRFLNLSVGALREEAPGPCRRDNDAYLNLEDGRFANHASDDRRGRERRNLQVVREVRGRDNATM
jgi:hypothetical protein